MRPRINLVIACYGGDRRTYCEEYETDRAYFLKLQLHSLQRLEHNLDQITFVSNGGREDYQNFLANQMVYQTVLHRENRGMSYGAFDAGWRTFPNFDYYIFIEDDYLFIKDGFDSVMLEIFESFPDCGYLCQLVQSRMLPYPSIYNGMASRKLLDSLGAVPGSDAYDENLISYYGLVETGGQHFMGNACRAVGLNVYDLGKHFKAPYVCNQNEYVCYYPNAPEYLIVPAQIYYRVLENPNYILENQTTDEDWQQFKNYYFGLRNIYLSDAMRKTLELAAAPFKVRTREDLARIASVYEVSVSGKRSA